METFKRLKQSFEEFKSRLNMIEKSDYAQKVVKYFIQIQLEFENWFWNAGIKVADENVKMDLNNLPEDSKIDSTIKTPSKIDEENRIIDEAITFINAEIKKLPAVYNKTAVIEICADTYERIVLSKRGVSYKKQKRIINLTTFAKLIFPKIEHKFGSEWTLKQFSKFLSSRTSAGSSRIISTLIVMIL